MAKWKPLKAPHFVPTSEKLQRNLVFYGDKFTKIYLHWKNAQMRLALHRI